MSKLQTVNRDQFEMNSIKITAKSVHMTGVETRTVNGKPEKVEVDLKAAYTPHKDLIEFRDRLKPMLADAYSIRDMFNEAVKYVTDKGKLKKLKDCMASTMMDIEVTKVSLSGKDQLRGAIISGKILSFNDGKQAMNSPRITFSSDNIGIEKEVEKIVQLIEAEAFKYFYHGKTGDETLFDQDPGENTDKKESAKAA